MNKLFSNIKQRSKLVGHKLNAVRMNWKYSYPGERMINVGVTGTDGKSTTCSFIHSLLQHGGYKTGLCSSVYFCYGDELLENGRHMTTLPPEELQQKLKFMVDNGCTHSVLEVSSHALHQHRVWGVPFDIAVFTNLSHEHLDYHKTLESYKKAKLRLFKNLMKRKKGAQKKTIIVNADDPQSADFYNCRADQKYRYSLHDPEADVYVSHIKSTAAKSTFILVINNDDGSTDRLPLTLSLPGEFNVSNALAAVCVALAKKYDLEVIKQAVKNFQPVPGRMEHVSSDRDFEVIIDLALTPAAVEKLYLTVRKLTKGRVISVFGCCGERDVQKRPIIGELAGRLTDIVVVTDDEPYRENSKDIRAQILSGIQKTSKIQGKTLFEIPDRKEAIQKAILMAKKDDAVVITGMGAYTCRRIGEADVPWKEREVVEEVLNTC